MILLGSLDRYVFALAESSGLVNRRSRRVFPVLESRMRVADSLGRQLQLLGLERRQVPARTLEEDLAERTEAQAGGGPRGSRRPRDESGSGDDGADVPGLLGTADAARGPGFGCGQRISV